jgi:hypothetical protein
MSSPIYEIIRGMEITKVKCMEMRTDCKLFSKKLEDLDNRIKLSLNQLPPIHRTEALRALTEASGKISLYASLMDFVVSKQDTSIRELKIREHIELTEELKPEEPDSFQQEPEEFKQ